MTDKLKRFFKWANDFPLVEAVLAFFVFMFLTIALANVIMDNKLIDEAFLKDVVDHVLKLL